MDLFRGLTREKSPVAKGKSYGLTVKSPMDGPVRDVLLEIRKNDGVFAHGSHRLGAVGGAVLHSKKRFMLGRTASDGKVIQQKTPMGWRRAVGGRFRF